MTSPINTSYARKYVVVATEPDHIILKVADPGLCRTYWKNFISATARLGASPMYLKIEQVPPPVTLVDQFAAYIPEYPIVHLEIDGQARDVSKFVTVNMPNTEVPGLFRLDYRLAINKDMDDVFWAAYVSVQQRPLLRKAAGGWTRDGYVLKTLNRLVMEPQFMEALHAAGEPLYGFMQANQHLSIRASQLPKYADVQAWGAGGVGESDTSTIFITGARLPQGSVVVYQNRMLQLHEPVYPDVKGAPEHMDPATHERAPGTYMAGAVFRSGKSSFVCIADADESVSLNDPAHWREGNLYRFTALEDGTFVLPRGRIPICPGSIEHIWVTADNQGYPFWVDIARTTAIGTYRGHYDARSFADYGPDDIVSYVGDNYIRLFARKRTDIQDEATLIYPPGHYLNPAWEEIYCHMPDEHSPLMSDYAIVPHTNSANAIVAKTWSVSEEMCRAYSHMVGIPQTIMDECGAKWSALLFALLVRTRNTYDGLRICMQAVGLDVKNLRLSEPSIEYYCGTGDMPEPEKVEDIYTQHANLRKLSGSIATLEPLGQWKEEEGCLRYDPDDPGAIQEYVSGEWVTRYRFAEIEPTQNFNNRYYDGDLDVLARLAEDAVKNLGDGRTWVKAPAWAGSYSRLVSDVIAYEIPIYVWVRLHMCLYDESKIETQTAALTSVLDEQRCGTNGIELFPSLYYSRRANDFVPIETGVFRQEGGEWVEVQPTRRNEARGSKIYEFDSVQYPIRIRAVDMANHEFVRYWKSAHTFGLLGLADSESTDAFKDILTPGVDDRTDLMLANGHVGVTALYRPRALGVDSAKALCWQYRLGEWALGQTAFTDWEDVACETIEAFEGGISEFMTTLRHIRTEAHGGDEIAFTRAGDALYLKDAAPEYIYCLDADNNVIAVFRISGDNIADWSEPHAEGTDSVRLFFRYE